MIFNQDGVAIMAGPKSLTVNPTKGWAIAQPAAQPPGVTVTGIELGIRDLLRCVGHQQL